MTSIYVLIFPSEKDFQIFYVKIELLRSVLIPECSGLHWSPKTSQPTFIEVAVPQNQAGIGPDVIH